MKLHGVMAAQNCYVKTRCTPEVFLAYICKLILYYFKVANNKKNINTKMLSGIKFCPTASVASASKFAKLLLFVRLLTS